MRNNNAKRARGPAPGRSTASLGFTLVELLIALALSTFLVGAVALTYIVNQSATRDAEGFARIQENIRVVSEYLVRDLRNAGFRDEDVMLVSHDAAIRRGYARIVAGGLRVRYAGQGHCAQAFDDIRLIENWYSVDGQGNLVCRGRSVAQSVGVSTTTLGGLLVGGTDVAWSAPVVLASGVESISFQFICPSNSLNCICPSTSPDCAVPVAATTDGYCNWTAGDATSSCIGVTANLVFEGLQSLAGTGPENLAITLNVAFRNVAVQRIIEGLTATAPE